MKIRLKHHTTEIEYENTESSPTHSSIIDLVQKLMIEITEIQRAEYDETASSENQSS